MPVLILVAMLAFVIRVGDAVLTFKTLSGEAFAEETSDKSPDKLPAKLKDSSADAVGTQPSTEHLKSPEIKESGAGDITLPSMEGASSEVPAKKWEDAKDVDTEHSDIKEQMYKDLVERRRDLDEREKVLSGREALLDAGQQELDRKYKEMMGIRDEIKSLLKQQSEEESSRLNSLVKIYTGMKPKDAARIFNTLDMDILVEVIGKMPEGKSAPIMAAMDADRARALTTLLAEQKKLPDIPQ
ncbi:MAG: flagellar protein FlbB [Alphaproteobacteria bacterium]|nr:flagellar protein FlbB [Alphaproteobacteria bacterium]